MLLVLFWTSLALGLVGGAVFTISWNLHGIPMIAVIPSGLLLGWLVSSVLFNITWIGKYSTYSSNDRDVTIAYTSYYVSYAGNIHAFEMGETYAIVFLLICLTPLVVPCRNNKWVSKATNKALKARNTLLLNTINPCSLIAPVFV